MTPVVAADEQVARFRAEVLPPLVVKYRPTRVLVFGSRARGAALEYSDLDVLIVSSAFTGILTACSSRSRWIASWSRE